MEHDGQDDDVELVVNEEDVDDVESDVENYISSRNFVK